MSLSNTAVPRYYGEFREQVLRGEIVVCREISMQMNRIDALIEDPRYYYDESKVQGFIDFCEEEMTLTDGSDVHMLPSFKLWAEDIFGWYYFVERSVYEPYPNGHGGRYVQKLIRKRLVNKQYLIVGRGAAKTLYDAWIQQYFLTVDTSTTSQITTAPTMRQAEEVLNPCRTAISRARGDLFKFLTDGSLQNTTGSKAARQKLAATKKGIQNFLTNSLLEVVPMDIEKLQGSRCKIATVDEWLSCEIREDPIGAIQQSASKNDDWLIVATSSEGTIRNGIGDSMKMELMKILRGEYVNPHVSIWYYKLDDISEVNDPAMWIKANPNLGRTAKYEDYQQEVERAEKAPDTRNDTLAKRFGIPLEGHTYFFTYDQTKPHRPRDFWGMPCAMGADLSQGDDFCAFTFLFPLRGQEFGVKTRSYITSLTFHKLHPATQRKYEDFIREGSLIVIEGTVLDMMDVYDDLDKHIQEAQYTVCAVGYDPYNAREFIERWEQENGPYCIEKVPQGARTESVPLGEIRNMAQERLLLFDEELMQYCMQHCVAIEDTNGNRKLYKQRREDKIDNVAALLDAWVAYKVNKEAFE